MLAEKRSPFGSIFAFALFSGLTTIALVLAHGRVLAIGDGLVESVPALFAPNARWQPDMFGGFPIYPDPNKAFWYPLRLLRFVPDGFNAYVIGAYAIASSATYGYIRAVTQSTLSGIASALAFTFGGFLVSHFGQPMIVEPACWFCVAMWALQHFIRSRNASWLIALCAALTIGLTAGQPQIAAFSIALLVGYLVFVGYERPLRRLVPLYAAGLFAITLGVSGGALAWYPTLALSAASVRVGLSFAAYVLDSAPSSHLALALVYPFVLGGGADRIYHGAVITGIYFVETANYVPFASFVLVPFAFFSERRRIAIYWAAVAVIGLALSVGDALPFASLTFHLPGFDLFRIPGRHAFEFTFAMAALTGLGVAALARVHRLRDSLFCAFGLASIVAITATIDVAANAADGARRPSVLIFLIAICIQTGLIVAALVRSDMRRSFATGAVAIGAIVFGFTAYWQDSPPASAVDVPPYARALDRLPRDIGQRIYTDPGANHPELTPNLPSMWGVPDVGGYTPLQSALSSVFLQTGEDGRLLDVDSPIVDLESVRYVATPAADDVDLTAAAPFSPSDLRLFVSAGQPTAPRTLTIGLREPRAATRLALVTALGASVSVPQGATVATVRVRSLSGAAQTMSLRAGIDTAELAFDRADVIHLMRHRKAAVYERDGPINWYVSLQPVALKGPIASVTFSMVDPVAALNIRKVSLIDDTTSRAYAFTSVATYDGAPTHFRHVTDVSGVSIFENLRSGYAVWIARPYRQNVDPLDAAAIAAERERLMHTELRARATVDESLANVDGTGHAALISMSPERRDAIATCDTSCLLVSNTTFSNDWKVDVDGRPAALLRTDGFLQGVVIPSGRHAVVFRYDPAAGTIGLVISLVSFATLALFVRCWKTRGVDDG